MIKIKSVKIGDVKINPNNPRLIKDDKFAKLVQSIKDLPQMLSIRPIVVNSDMVVLGGNMRLKACKEAGLKEVPIIIADNLTEEQQREFLIKDNVSGGDWDWTIIESEWNAEQLSEWGLDVWKATDDINLYDFFNENEETEKAELFKIVLEYTEEEYAQVNEALKNHSGTKENIFYKLLVL